MVRSELRRAYGREHSVKVVTVIGARGFVGSALVRAFTDVGYDVRAITRDNYASMSGQISDVVVDASGNSVKYFADRDPVAEFDGSVAHRLRTLMDFPATLQVHISSVDVYADLTSPAATREDIPFAGGRPSNYGLHKRISENLVQHYSERWLIVRLAGMVGPGLRKNPVFDITTGNPLRIHPDSQYQFMPTDSAAATVRALVERDLQNDIVNVCGSGLISPQTIARLAALPLNLSELPADAQPRIVHVSIEKVEQFVAMPQSEESVRAYIAAVTVAAAAARA
jgi:nucleoside-diphosphate-sugar epimerase